MNTGKNFLLNALAAVVAVQGFSIYTLQSRADNAVDNHRKAVKAQGVIMRNTQLIARQRQTIRELREKVERQHRTIAYLRSPEHHTARMLVSRYDLNEKRAQTLAGLYVAASEETGVSVDLLAAITYVESRFQPNQVSHANAIGIMQVVPKWWVHEFDFLENANDLHDERKNVRAGALIIKRCMDRFGSVEKAIRCYHGGPGGVYRPMKSTLQYSELVGAMIQ